LKTGDFFNAIFGDATGLATIVTRHRVSGELTEQKFFDYPAQLDDMIAHSENHKDSDVYYSPILYTSPRRIKENAKTLQVVYADADSCAPENFMVEPSISVQTSEGRWHTYWILDQEANPQVVSLLAKKIAYAHSHQGCDKSGWNTTKLLRVPNTMNRKEGKNDSVVATSNGSIYSLQELQDVYGDVEVEPIRELSLEALPQSWPDLMATMAKIQSNPEIIGLYMEQPSANADMSKLLWKLQLELFRQGLTAEEVFVIARNAKCNKYHSPLRPKRLDADGDLWREVQRAEASSVGSEVIEYAPVEPIEVAEAVDTTDIVFLTKQEQEIVDSRRTFVDDYMAWATSKTDAAPQYHVASAFTILSSAFSDIGYAIPRYGKMGLNLWFMVLGETTLTRKSTSRNLMLRMIREFEKYSGYQIDIGSDATPEGVTAILAERDGKTSLLHRDEVQGMFKDFINKTYMASAAERFTELYDGQVPVVIRSGKGKSQTERATTNFIMYLMGITSKVADVLTTEYFRSGFLARFIYVTADTPERTKNSEDIQQADEFEVVVRDSVMDTLVKGLYNALVFWQKKGQPSPRPVRLSAPSLERFNQFKWEMGNIAEKHPDSESIEPSRQRLALSVWKCAILLAMHEQKEEVELRHMLTAIYYSQDWFKNLIKMASAISASEWQRDVDKLEALVIDRGGKIRYEEAYRKFNNKRKREFDEMVQALHSQARVQIAVDNRKSYLEVIR
jgi:hypothetical protein